MAKPLDEYQRKRDFRNTPEPRGQVPKTATGATFVVHRHEARRLHYDLRLEMDGVLKSWAVPRGFSFVPKDKRLAVRTEDHPMQYYSFEGVIPAGQYGAGTMTIWDRGEFAVTGPGDGLHGIEDGKLEFTLTGDKLRGEWHLVRTNAEKNEWLLFKASDCYARSAEEPGTPFDFRAAPPAKFPRRQKFMEPKSTRAPFRDAEWLFEVDLRGKRVWIGKREGSVRLVDRAGRDWASRVPSVVDAVKRVRAEAAVMDGVLLAMDAGERPSESELETRLETGGQGIQLYAFDLLHCDGRDLRGLPLRERKGALTWILPGSPVLLPVDHVEGEGEKLAVVVASGGLAGIVAKQSASKYRGGPSSEWVAIRTEAPAKKSKSASLRESLGELDQGQVSQVKYTNLRKVFWPKTGHTKGDLVQYYERIAETLLPYLRDRPLHMNRFPDGVGGKSFYQKDAPDHVPDWVPIESIASGDKKIRYIVCEDRSTLAYLANLGSIDLHPWLSRRANLESPDWAVIDLDPKQAPFDHVMRLARTAGKVLRGIGLRPLLKTSGATGLHVYIPLQEGYSYDHARMFCEAVARYLVREHPDIATVERVVGQRGRQVYVDFLQNRRGQTVVPPYVVRPREVPSVSTPLDWDELSGPLDPSQFTIQNVPERVARQGDLFQAALTDRQDLMPAIQALQDLLQGR